MNKATGPSRAATGSITANTDSTLTLADPSSCVLIDNHSGETANIRLNGAATNTIFDLQLADGERAWITDIVVKTIHVYVNATSGIHAVYW